MQRPSVKPVWDSSVSMQATSEQALRIAKEADGKAEASDGRLITIASQTNANQSELLELAKRLSKLQAEMPSSAELGSVKSELDRMKSVVLALEGSSELQESVQSMQRKLDSLVGSVELSKEDMLKAHTDIKQAQEELSKHTKTIGMMATQAEGLDRMRPIFEAVRGQVPFLLCI